MNEEKSGYGYGKRPLWQWVILYVVIGGALYGLVYYFFFASKGGYNYGTVNTTAETQTQAPATTQPGTTTTGQTTSSPASVAPAPQTTSVIISNFAFSPKQISVRAGTKVTWTNKDGVAHTVTSDDGFFESGALGTGSAYSYVFPVPGTYKYHCRLHPYMTATIVVTQ